MNDIKQFSFTSLSCKCGKSTRFYFYGSSSGTIKVPCANCENFIKFTHNI